MAATRPLAAALAALALALAWPGTPTDAAAGKTLRVHPTNPRYFSDRSGRAVYLTGSHVWSSLTLADVWLPCTSEPQPFDYGAYLDKMTFHGHNFMRLWRLEHFYWNECNRPVVVRLHPWPRTGPGTALDGGPRFDLSRFDEAYFERLRQHVVAARDRGIYVSVMLFEGVMLQQAAEPWDWDGHPFHPANNVNGIDGDENGDGEGLEIQMLADPAVTAVQRAYVRKVVDTVNDLDNVLYEIANESGHYSTAWQYHMIRYVKAYERTKPKQHPVGMTFQHSHGSNAALLASPADWISPFGREYMTNPPVATGNKVSLSDTDHHCGICGEPRFAWTNFMRGHNPIFMDPMDDDPTRHGVRSAMGQTLRYARRINLAASRPRPSAASTRFALIVPRRQYLVYQPGNGSFTVNLRRAPGRFAVEWFRPDTDTTIRRARALPGGRVRAFTPPFPGPAVLYLRALPRR